MTVVNLLWEILQMTFFTLSYKVFNIFLLLFYNNNLNNFLFLDFVEIYLEKCYFRVNECLSYYVGGGTRTE